MRIQLFDRGTPQGKALFSRLEKVCHTLQVYDPEYIQDMKKVYDMGVQGKTVLLIDREVAFVDRYPTENELSTIIQEYL